MFMGWKRNRSLSFNKKSSFLCFVSIFFFSLFTLSSSITPTITSTESSGCLLSSKTDFYFQDLDKRKDSQKESMEASLVMPRRLLGGPGSTPPRCTSKCGRCTPCQPVHVAVPPGTPVTAEYYPETWRCKCGNRLYMP